MTSTANVQDSLKKQFLALTAAERDEKRRIAAEAAGDTKLAAFIQKEIDLRDASFAEMEKSEEIECRAKQSQRDAETMRLEEEFVNQGRDRAPRYVPEPDTNSETDLARHRRFMEDDWPPDDMRHIESVDPETDDRVFALLDDGCNRTCHTSYWAWKAKHGFNKVNQDLGNLITTNVIPRYKGIGSAKGLGKRKVAFCAALEEGALAQGSLMSNELQNLKGSKN